MLRSKTQAIILHEKFHEISELILQAVFSTLHQVKTKKEKENIRRITGELYDYIERNIYLPIIRRYPELLPVYLADIYYESFSCSLLTKKRPGSPSKLLKSGLTEQEATQELLRCKNLDKDKQSLYWLEVHGKLKKKHIKPKPVK
ncbi:MAG: hypothetical protein LBM04_09720 [Opitutaceae bacterium]|jgi:hypothetical protein|nr:hypothetical protein [Opitutaceae bacterium]